ncbi:hypothetical protein V2J09_012787 [Rumex salicifolius]
MNHESASGISSGMAAMQFFQTTQNPSWSASSTVADFTDPLPYSSIFFTSSTSDDSNSPARTNSTVGSSVGATLFRTSAGASDLSLLMQEHHDLLVRHKSCLSQLRDTFREAETLRQENTNLRVANSDLSNRLNRLVEAYLQSQYGQMKMISPGSSSLSPEIVTPPITEKFSGLRLAEKMRECARWESGESPTSVIESDRAERDVDRVSIPKSISVRSTGFLKVAGQVAPKGTNTCPSREANRNRQSVPVDAPQKVYVRGGGNKKEGPIELEVHNQGMVKTELCNKWQETGSCPYGEQCQFAHGFQELRPVLRHPRYKTEVCRMVLAGDPCPYGHRCHFRHALTQQEKLMLPHPQGPQSMLVSLKN